MQQTLTSHPPHRLAEPGLQVPSKPGQPTPGPDDPDMPGQQQPGQKEPGQGQPVEPDTDMQQPRLG